MKKAFCTWLRKISQALLCLLILINASCNNRSDTKRPGDDSQFSTLFGSPENLGTLESRKIDEASGLVASRSNEAYLWTHNDSGGEPEIYLLTKSGQSVGTYRLENAQNIDWEDMAVGPGPQRAVNYIFVGDIGDNEAVHQSRKIYRVAEPDLVDGDLPPVTSLTDVDLIEYQYPDGPRDAETLMIDPFTKDIIIVSKREDKVNVYRLAFPQSTTELNTAEFMVQLPYTGTVGGDISPDGLEILIKTYDEVFYWSRNEQESVPQALSKKALLLNYKSEPQGEAIAWALDGSMYFTLSEAARGQPTVLYGYKRD